MDTLGLSGGHRTQLSSYSNFISGANDNIQAHNEMMDQQVITNNADLNGRLTQETLMEAGIESQKAISGAIGGFGLKAHLEHLNKVSKGLTDWVGTDIMDDVKKTEKAKDKLRRAGKLGKQAQGSGSKLKGDLGEGGEGGKALKGKSITKAEDIGETGKSLKSNPLKAGKKPSWGQEGYEPEPQLAESEGVGFSEEIAETGVKPGRAVMKRQYKIDLGGARERQMEETFGRRSTGASTLESEAFREARLGGARPKALGKHTFDFAEAETEGGKAWGSRGGTFKSELLVGEKYKPRQSIGDLSKHLDEQLEQRLAGKVGAGAKAGEEIQGLRRGATSLVDRGSVSSVEGTQAVKSLKRSTERQVGKIAQKNLDKIGGKLGLEKGELAMETLTEEGLGNILKKKVGTAVVKGVKYSAAIGSVLGGAMAIEKELSDKPMNTLEHVSNIGTMSGAGLEIAGLTAEMTGIGAPVGVLLQAMGGIVSLASTVTSGVGEYQEHEANKLAATDETEKMNKEAQDHKQDTLFRASIGGMGAVATGHYNAHSQIQASGHF